MGSPPFALTSSVPEATTVENYVVRQPPEHSRHRCLNSWGPSLLEENKVRHAVYIRMRAITLPFENYTSPVRRCHWDIGVSLTSWADRGVRLRGRSRLRVFLPEPRQWWCWLSSCSFFLISCFVLVSGPHGWFTGCWFILHWRQQWLEI